MKDHLDRAITVLALGLLIMIIDLAGAAGGRIEPAVATLVIGIDLVVTATAGILVWIFIAEKREVGPKRMKKVREIIEGDKRAEAARNRQEKMDWPRRDRCGVVACRRKPTMAFPDSDGRTFYYCGPHADEADAKGWFGKDDEAIPIGEVA